MEKYIIERILNLLTIIFLFLSISLISKQDSITLAQEINNSESESIGQFDQLHSTYDSLLRKYVHNARVDYKGFINSSERFDTYLRQLGSVSETDFARWTREEKLAFWINAYNAFTIKAIMDHYPINSKLSLSSLIYPKNSIRQINGVWDKLQFKAVGKNVSLNEIEHKILRKEFNEPRNHFAIVCASIGCPDLMARAYTADKIDSQLESQAIKFVNNTSKGAQINSKKMTIKLSKIFDWFGEDFIDKNDNSKSYKDRSAKERAVLNFIMNHLGSEEEKKFIEDDKFKISYFDYDWRLNENNGSETE